MTPPLGRRFALPFAFPALLLGAGCKTSPKADADASAPAASAAPSASSGSPSAGTSPGGAGPMAASRAARPAGAGPVLAVNAFTAVVHERPDSSSPALGYLRLGAVVAKSAEQAGVHRCSQGWYGIAPRGFVCVGKGATLDPDDPIVRASATRPSLDRALPYQYAFVRAVAPLYLRIPTAEEQYKTEFKLREHLGWWERHASEVNQVRPGANDVSLDEQGVPRAAPPDPPWAAGSPQPAGAEESPTAVPGESPTAVPGESPAATRPYRPSTELSIGELLGGQTDQDPIPFWLQDGRQIPNIAPLSAPPSHSKLFADRVRRHTGLALIGSFVTGPESLSRRFAVTIDLRLVPADKLKPDTASMFHGVAVTPEFGFPLAFVRPACDPQKLIGCAHAYALDARGAHSVGTLAHQSVVKLTGKRRAVESVSYHEMADGHWIKTSDASLGDAPSEWPPGAKAGKKWIEISILDGTLVLWEGQTPVYFTLVSAGQDGPRDPKTTKSTPQGTFRIFHKQLTATMDSNERSGPAGGAPSQVSASFSPSSSASAHREASAPPASATRSEGRAATPGSKARASSSATPPARPSGDGEEGAKSGESPFELRDVPYIQYFESGYALHAAYWHDAFGTLRSHGCVNLSPIDARRVFAWTEPSVPEGWHGISIGVGQGTLVVIHK